MHLSLPTEKPDFQSNQAIRFSTTSKQIQSAAPLTDDILSKVLTCPSDFYVLISQLGVHAVDYSKSRSAPRLRERVLRKDKAVQSSFTVSEVVGEVDITYIQSLLESRCGAETTTVDASCMFVPSVEMGIPVKLRCFLIK
jgi:hypothetical protein